MAYGIQLYDGQKKPVDSAYPQGDIKDNTGPDDGTVNNRKSNADMQQFFVKLMKEANIAPNGLPDNEYSGNQFFAALRKAARPYFSYIAVLSQVGTGNPFILTTGEDELGITAVNRLSTGIYEFTCAPLPDQAFVSISPPFNGLAGIQCASGGSTSFILKTTDYSGTLSDNILDQTTIEVKCFK